MKNHIKIKLAELGYTLKIDGMYINATFIEGGITVRAVKEGVGGSIVWGATQWNNITSMRQFWNQNRTKVLASLNNPYHSINGSLVSEKEL